ncbi:MAG: hypothetical protein ACR2GK_10620 [Gemmatimonadaceae bacterium]
MSIRLLTMPAILVVLACNTEVNEPMSEPEFKVPPRTIARTWIASGKEEQLTAAFLDRFPPKDAEWYREMLLRADAVIEMPNDPVGQKLLKEIYNERWKANAAAERNLRK